MGKPAVNRRPLTLTGGLLALGRAAALAVTTPSAAGAQTRGHYGGSRSSPITSTTRADSRRRLAGGMGSRLCPTGGQVVRIS